MHFRTSDIICGKFFFDRGQSVRSLVLHRGGRLQIREYADALRNLPQAFWVKSTTRERRFQESFCCVRMEWNLMSFCFCGRLDKFIALLEFGTFYTHTLVEQLPWSNSKTSACCFSLLMFLHKPCIEVSESKFTLVVFKETIQWWTWINQTLLATKDKNGVVIRLTISSWCKCRFARRFN